MIQMQFFSKITYDKGSDEPAEIMLGCGMTEMSYIMRQLENAINIMMPITV